jgi:predicted RecA/RadA family phage recombinase
MVLAMKNYIQPGEMVTALAPANVLSGDGVLVGGLFGVAAYDALSGAEVELGTRGVYELPKTTGQAWAAAWAPIYWDNTTKKCTTTAASNLKIGVNMKAEISGSAVARVRLNGVF